MKRLFPMAAAAAVMLSAASAMAAELPTFEALGFPITPHQIVVVGTAHIEEQSPTSTLTLAGMPASPVQIAVLTPRAKEVASAINPSKARPSSP
jgi:hypothetical protein